MTPPVVVASDNAWLYDSSHNLDMENTPGGPIEEAATVQALTPFVLNSRDAWLPVLRLYGPDDQSSELYVYMTSDAGRRWALRGRFPGAGWGDIFFLSRSTGFIETGDAAAAGEDPAQIYATLMGASTGGRSRPGPALGPGARAAAQLPSATIATRTACLSPAPGSASPPGTASPGRRTSNARATGAVSGVTSALRPITAMAAATYPPVFSSPEVGSMVVEVDPVLLFATTTDAGRHWELRHLPPAGGAAGVGRRHMPTWLRGPRLGPHLGGRGGPRTVHDHRRRALLESVVFAHGPYLSAAARFPHQPAARFPGPEGGLGIRGQHRRGIGRPLGPPMAYDRRRAALVDIFSGRPMSHSWWEH